MSLAQLQEPILVARAQKAPCSKPGLGAIQMEVGLGPPGLAKEWTCGCGTPPPQVASEPLERYAAILSKDYG